MDVNQVLTGTISADASIRTAAEQQLQQAAEADFSGYLVTLSRELANDSADSSVRTAAGLALKNSFSARDFARLREVQRRWVEQVDAQVKQQVKTFALETLGATDRGASQSAAQFIASIAAIELPREQWPNLMQTLVENVNSGTDQKKQASLTTIGFICETDDQDLRDSLAQHSNAILTAVVQGARKEETNVEIRNAAITALGDSLEFVRTNFENEGERNYIMQVICEATQATDTRIQQGAYGCLNRIMSLYYEKMRFYMEKALFGLTIQGMKNEDEDVANLPLSSGVPSARKRSASKTIMLPLKLKGVPKCGSTSTLHGLLPKRLFPCSLNSLPSRTKMLEMTSTTFLVLLTNVFSSGHRLWEARSYHQF